MIDNGHGRETAGKRSPNGKLREWQWCREIALRVVKELKAKGYDARLTTPEDNDVLLRERCRRINAVCNTFGAGNVVSVSIHINAAGDDGRWHQAKGWSVFVSGNASSKSRRLARLLYDEADLRNLKGDRSVPRERYWIKNLAMCRDTKCPAVLTENLFMDNEDDCLYLLSDEGKDEIINLHVQGIIAYIKEMKK